MTSSNKIKLGVDGFLEHPWPSVERTRRFYERALISEFDVEVLDAREGQDFYTGCDAILSFYSQRCWELQQHPPVPLLFALHGGAVLHQDFMRPHLGRLETSDVLIVNCTSDITVMSKLFNADKPAFCHLPLPVDMNTFHPRSREDCRATVSAEDFDYVIGFVGRLLPQRNLHRFLYLLAELKKQLAPRTIAGVVVGNYWIDYPVLPYVTEAYPAIIRALIDNLELNNEVIYFPANVSDEELALCYGAMDILVHPTNALDENFGYVPLEAMACGTPVIAAAYGGVKDSVVSGETGFLLPTWITRTGIRFDFIQAVNRAMQLLEDRQLHERMSDSGVRRVREAYSDEACGRRLQVAVKSAVDARRTGNQRAVSVAPEPVRAQPSGMLPALENPWESYQHAVADYVSTKCPTVGPQSKLMLSAPLENDGRGGFRLMDPAWPATFRLDDRELALVQRCQTPVRWSDITTGDPNEDELVNQLIADGLLLCSA